MTVEYKHDCSDVNKPSCLPPGGCFCNVGPMKYGERLRAARLYAGLTQAELAEKIGGVCSQANISGLERGCAAGSEYTAQFADACGVRAMWLAMEQGEMLASSALLLSEPTAHIARRLETLTSREQYRVVKLIDAYLTPDGRDDDPR